MELYLYYTNIIYFYLQLKTQYATTLGTFKTRLSLAIIWIQLREIVNITVSLIIFVTEVFLNRCYLN